MVCESKAVGGLRLGVFFDFIKAGPSEEVLAHIPLIELAAHIVDGR
jgi:hypothetical protein